MILVSSSLPKKYERGSGVLWEFKGAQMILKTTESEHKNLDNNWEKADTTARLSLIIQDLGDYLNFIRKTLWWC